MAASSADHTVAPSRTGTVAAVTGAGRGLGEAIAFALAARGTAVVVNDTGAAIDGSGSDPRVADSVAAQIVRAGGRAVAHHASVATMAGGRSLVDTAIDRFGRLDVLVNCAGNSVQAPPWEFPEDAWDAVVDTHLKGHFSCMRAAAVPMRAQGSGRMVAVSSQAGLHGVADAPAYCAAKAGVIGLMKSFALALEPAGVTVNAIVPSATTRLSPPPPRDVLLARAAAAGVATAAELPEDQLRHMLGGPTTIANFVAYLAGPEASDITGSVFTVSGGHVGLLGAPTEVASLDRPGGSWDEDDLANALRAGGLHRRTLR